MFRLVQYNKGKHSMKITRELIDNGQKIIHVNYTKKDKKRREKKFVDRINKIAEENRKCQEEEQKKLHPEITEEKQEDKKV